MEDKKKKQTQYAILMNKLKKATDNEFYYEAIFIEYAIFEDRTESILRHANINFKNNDKKGYSLKLADKLNKIKSRKEFQDKYIKKHITQELIDKIRDWKDERDKLIHELVKNTYDLESLKNIALDGECLVKRFASKSQLVNKYLEENKLLRA